MDYNDWQNTNQNPSDQNNYNYENYGYPRRESGLALASMITGILSVITCCTGVSCIPLGALGILFAVLSRKKDRRFSSMAIGGLFASILGLAIGALLLYFSFRILYDPAFRSTYIDPIYQQYYGIDFEEFLQKYYRLLNQ